MFVAIAIGLWRSRRAPAKVPSLVIACVALLFGISLLATRLDPKALMAVGQWWMQVVILSLFVVTLVRNHVQPRVVLFWFVSALLPVAILGCVQYATQQVVGSSWLGIASQLPETAGVSVVEHGVYRVLRIYGTFPHPNIFGGWLVSGIIASFIAVLRVETKKRALFFIFASALLSLVLLLTYSRSAWIAAVVGVLGLFLTPLLTKAGRGEVLKNLKNQFCILALLASFFCVVIVGYSQRDHILARSDTSSRLESKSVDVRLQSLKDGWSVFRRHPWIGIGPNAELLALAARYPTLAPAPLESPHNVYLLAFEDIGIIGSIAVLGLLVIAVRNIEDKKRAVVFVLPILVLGMFDHYLWSYWGGQSLVAIVALLSLLQDPVA